jgi:hypothetical protein
MSPARAVAGAVALLLLTGATAAPKRDNVVADPPRMKHTPPSS